MAHLAPEAAVVPPNKIGPVETRRSASTNSPVWLFVRSHRVPEIAGITVISAIALMLTQGNNYGLADQSGQATTPLVLLLPLVPATAIGTSVHSVPASMEALAGARLTRHVAGLIAILTAATVAVLFAAAALAGIAMGGPSATGLAVMTTRSVIGWIGIALISAVLLGGHYAWVLPAASVTAVTLFGYASTARPYSWNIAAAQPGDPGSAVVAVTLYAIGFAAWARCRYSRLER